VSGERDARALGCYVLPGGVTDPRLALDQARATEALGFGAVWIGERFDTKDLPSLASAIGQVTERVSIGAAVTVPGVRHPMVLASMGQTLQSLTNERFSLGFGRSAAWRWRQYGVPAPTLASLGDTADILRRLWAGETVTYSGPAGEFPELRLAQRADVAPPPLLLAAIGPKTLALAGSKFDGVILHPFLTPAAVHRSLGIVRDAAIAAGRDPAKLRGIATVVVAPDRTDRDAALAVGARAAGYLQLRGLGDALAAANRWSADDLADYRAQPKLAALGERSADKSLSRDELVELSRALPADWLSSSSAIGSGTSCADRLREYLAADADELVLHGSTAEHLGGLADAFSAGVPA
jgi:probable F420-dependent oxidoreductase